MRKNRLLAGTIFGLAAVIAIGTITGMTQAQNAECPSDHCEIGPMCTEAELVTWEKTLTNYTMSGHAGYWCKFTKADVYYCPNENQYQCVPKNYVGDVTNPTNPDPCVP